MYYVIDSYNNKVLESFQQIYYACEYVLHIALDDMVKKNDFITPLQSNPRWWIVKLPIGYTIHDNIYTISHKKIQNIHQLQYLFEYNQQYQSNRKVYTKWLQQIHFISKYDIIENYKTIK